MARPGSDSAERIFHSARAVAASARKRSGALSFSTVFVQQLLISGRVGDGVGRAHRNLCGCLRQTDACESEYGGREEGLGRPMLHAWRLRLRHPRTGAEMTFEAPPPADFQAFWALAS